MKKLLIMSIAMLAIMATVFTVSAFAANTVEITGVTLSKYYDTAVVEGVTTQTFNDAYANVTVNYTVAEDTAGAVDRLTFYLAAQDLSAALEGEEAKVVYIDETVNPAAESFTFVIEKARIKNAANATVTEGTTYTNATVEGFELTFKLGGTDVDTAATETVIYNNPTVYGDLLGKGKAGISARSAKAILNAVAEVGELTDEQKIVGDVDGKNGANSRDAKAIMNIVAEVGTYEEILGARLWAY